MDSAAVTLPPEHELLGQRRARWRRGVREHGHRLGDRARERGGVAAEVDRHELSVGRRDQAKFARALLPRLLARAVAANPLFSAL